MILISVRCFLFNSEIFTLAYKLFWRKQFSKYAAFYEMRLMLGNLFQIIHINEFLYTEIETDTRKSGEKTIRLRKS